MNDDHTISSVTISAVQRSDWKPAPAMGRPDDVLGLRVTWSRRDGRSVTREKPLSTAWEDAERLLAFAEKAKPGDELSFAIDPDITTYLPVEFVASREFLLDVASALEITIARAVAHGITAPEQRVDLVDGAPRRAAGDVAA